jgi:L,D-transpeptidase ErfK/SrfK
VQVFEDFEERLESPLEKVMEAMLHFETAKGPLDLDREALSKALEEKSGVPVAVGRLRDE